MYSIGGWTGEGVNDFPAHSIDVLINTQMLPWFSDNRAPRGKKGFGQHSRRALGGKGFLANELAGYSEDSLSTYQLNAFSWRRSFTPSSGGSQKINSGGGKMVFFQRSDNKTCLRVDLGWRGIK